MQIVGAFGDVGGCLPSFAAGSLVVAEPNTDTEPYCKVMKWCEQSQNTMYQ